MQIAFIGLGQMGRPMAENVLKAGHRLIVHNRSPGPVDALVEKGAIAAAHPAEAADGSDVVMTCLLHPDQVLAVYLGSDGILQAHLNNRVLIDFSTVEPALSREIGAVASQRGARFLDAPISGGPKGAAAATLTIMVGGAAEDFAEVRPVLEALGTKLLHLGPVGAGTTAKVCNQILTGVTHALVGEAMVLGTKAGLDPRVLYDVLRQSSGQSNSLDRAVPNFILPGNFEPAFALEGIIKDLECAIRTAKSLGVRLMLPNVAQQLYVEAAALGYGQQDVAAVIRPMEAIAGVTVREGRSPS